MNKVPDYNTNANYMVNYRPARFVLSTIYDNHTIKKEETNDIAEALEAAAQYSKDTHCIQIYLDDIKMHETLLSYRPA